MDANELLALARGPLFDIALAIFVAMVAVVGSPDEIRTEIVKAFIVPKADVDASAEVAADIKEFVKLRLAAHEYPREIEFVDALPMTATGKIMRKDLKALEIQRKSKA